METTEAKKQVSAMMEEPEFDSATQTLTIKFKKGGVYTYSPFSQEMFNEFHDSPSWGKYYHANKATFEGGKKQVSQAEPPEQLTA